MAGIVNDVYKQYKEDTEFVAGWLAETSLRCGYELTTLGGQPYQTPQGLNRKAGKQVGHGVLTCTKRSNSIIRPNTPFPMSLAETIAT
jgi:hypothetical protein